MKKLDKAALAILGATLLFGFVECSLSKDKEVADKEIVECRKFCEVRNTEPKTIQPGICICQ